MSTLAPIVSYFIFPLFPSFCIFFVYLSCPRVRLLRLTSLFSCLPPPLYFVPRVLFFKFPKTRTVRVERRKIYLDPWDMNIASEIYGKGLLNWSVCCLSKVVIQNWQCPPLKSSSASVGRPTSQQIILKAHWAYVTWNCRLLAETAWWAERARDRASCSGAVTFAGTWCPASGYMWKSFRM
jgi:hypothetical protein